MKKKNNKHLVFFIVIGLVILLNLFLLFFNYRTVLDLKNSSKEINYEPLNYTLPQINISNNPLSLEGFSNAYINITDKMMIIQANCTALGLTTNEFQIYSIKQGLDKKIDVRPTIHDAMLDALKHFNTTLIMVKITDAKDDLYFANVYFKNENNLLNIDVKPSDAVALAVRTGMPVYISNNLLNNYGEKIC